MKLLTNKSRRNKSGSEFGFRYLLRRIQNLEIEMAATQQDVDSLTTEVTTVGESLATAKTNIEAEFAALESQIAGGTPASDLDLTALKAAVDGLSTPSTELENLKPTAATPPASTDTPAAGEDEARASV